MSWRRDFSVGLQGPRSYLLVSGEKSYLLVSGEKPELMQETDARCYLRAAC